MNTVNKSTMFRINDLEVPNLLSPFSFPWFGDRYMPLSGFHGVLSGFLVGVKQIIPDQELPLVSLLKIRAKVLVTWVGKRYEMNKNKTFFFFGEGGRRGAVCWAIIWLTLHFYWFVRSIWYELQQIGKRALIPSPCFVQWLPSLMVLMSAVISFFTEESAKYLPTIIFGTYMSWIYLRYLQRKPETNLRGDPSDEFSFSTFFPEVLR